MAALTSSETDVVCPCDDIIRFNKALNRMRQSDDRFIYKLNTILPTQSFKSKTDPVHQCEALYHQMLQDYDARAQAIQRCIDIQKENIRVLRQRQTENKNDPVIKLDINEAALMLKQFQKEVPQEEILRNKSFKLFHEKCGDYYLPPASSR